jgi:SNF2 family DNA or RNA helicase
MRENCELELVNPEGLPKLRSLKGRWDLVVVDESTKFKTWGTKTRMRPLKSMLTTIPKRIILTGTPTANSLADLHSQMYIVDDGDAIGKTKTFFQQTFMAKGGYLGREWIIKESMRDELQSRIQDKVLRMQAEDYLDMPQLVINDIWCQMPPKCCSEYNRLKRELYAELETGDVFASTAGAAYAKCKQFANGTVYTSDILGNRTSHIAHDEKISALVDLVEELCSKPLLVGYQYTHDLERIMQHRAFKKAKFIRGGMKIKEVEGIVAEWNRGEIPVLLCQTDAVSHGMNMQEACNDVAWFGVTDKPEVYDQFFRRVYRLGVSGDQVRIHRLLTKGTVDEIMVERLSGKFATQSEFLESLKQHARS